MITIYKKDGTVYNQSRNGMGIRKAVGRFPVEVVRIIVLEHGRGQISIYFKKLSFLNAPAACTFEWESFSVLCAKLKAWRNLYGVKLYVNGIAEGLIDKNNPALIRGMQR